MLREYGANFKKEMSELPIWQIGTPCQIGDIGIVRDNTFCRLHSIFDLSTFLPFSTHSTSPMEIDIVHNANLNFLANASGLLQEASISFSSKGSFWFKATQSVYVSARNIRELESALKQVSKWNENWRVVTGVRSTPEFSLFYSNNNGANAKASGTLTTDLPVEYSDLRLTAAFGANWNTDSINILRGNAITPISVSIAKRKYLTQLSGKGFIPEDQHADNQPTFSLEPIDLKGDFDF